MKKRLSLLLSGLFALQSGFSQSADKCATMPAYQAYSQNQVQKNRYMQAEQLAKTWLNNPANAAAVQKKQNTIITIPVVVHVVYKNAAQNVPDSQIVKQIQILNECYRKQNANYSSVRPVFDTLGADIEIQFCLAANDPQGNPTTGILRKSAPSSAAFDPILNMDKVKSSLTNGDDPWPNNKYLNIWVCDMSFFGVPFVLGYATFPGSDPLLDGVVIQSEYFGPFTAAAPNNLGKTTVHEVGHWLGMRHIWADDDSQSTGQCDSTDFVDDTPNQGAKSQSDCNLTINSCANEAPFWGTIDPPDMVENYMDYSADACMALFTKGQKARMYSFLSTDPARMAIQTSPAGCSITGLNELKNLSDFVFVYPNPANDILQINVTHLTVSDLKCEIYDQRGVLVKQLPKLDFQNSVNISGLAAGIYMVKIYNASAIATQKVIINH